MISFSFFNNVVYSSLDFNGNNEKNLKTWSPSQVNSSVKQNTYLKDLQNPITDFNIWTWWQKWILNSFIKIALDLKNLFFLIAWIYFLILVIKLLFSEKTEEEVWNFKKWIIWISLWIVVTQISFYFVNIIFDRNIDNVLATNFVNTIIKPFIWLLETATSFFFLAIMVYAFFQLITSNWDEEKAKTWKQSVLYAVIWFIVVQISSWLVSSIYWVTQCTNFQITNCANKTDINWIAFIVVRIIDWMNGFVAIVVTILIIYAWFLTLISAWDEEKLKKAKSSIIFITIWLFILFANYLILTFFLLPEVKI